MDIDIGAISLDVANFRHARVSHERDAMRLLLANDKVHKVSDLARDIVDEGGLDPSSRLIVTESETAPGAYICLEGNRRITALKAMMTPALGEGLPLHHVYRQLSPKFMALDINTVDCVVLDRTTAAKWIKRKHYKGMGGEAVQQWNAVATARSDASEGVYSRWMTSLAFLEDHGVEAESLRDQIANKTTTVERVLESAQIPLMLGLIFDRSGTVKPENGDNGQAVTLILTMLTEMTEPEFKETLVSTKAQQKEWLERFSHLSVKATPPIKDKAGKSSDPAGQDKRPEEGNEYSDKKTAETASGITGTKPAPEDGTTASSRSKPVKDRKCLADKGLRISNPNLNKFYAELRGLKVEKNPFISAAVIRVFLEKATTEFLEAIHVPPPNKTPGATWHDFGTKLRYKVDAALKKIDPGGADLKFAAARDVAAGNQDRLHSLDQLNRAIHDHMVMPLPSEILMVWNRFHPYFCALFEEIEKPRK